MTTRSYLYEKACYVLKALAGIADDLCGMSDEPDTQMKLRSFLEVGLRHALISCCGIAGCQYKGDWSVAISRGGTNAWTADVEPVIAVSMVANLWNPSFQGDPEDSQNDEPFSEPVESLAEELLPEATRTLAALLDLVEVIQKSRAAKVKSSGIPGNLSVAFNGATKVISALTESEWKTECPELLTTRGRDAIGEVIEEVLEGDYGWMFEADDLEPLDEAWFTGMDPMRTNKAEQEAERERRANVSSATRSVHDLVIPAHFQHANLDGLLVDKVPGHRSCLEYATNPEGTLVLHGEFASGLFPIQWAIARHWFVNQLQRVTAVDWHTLAEGNLMAQNRQLWHCPRMIVESLRPVWLMDGGRADPCYAEKMLTYRIDKGLPTVITVERCGLDELNLKEETVEKLRESRNVVLERLTEEDRKGSDMFR